MSILIRGMEMPKNCCECPVNLYVCQRGYEYLLAHPELYDRRADDCPISYVPPHGRLIDADALLKDITPTDEDEDNGAKLLMNVFCQVVKTRPTIIPEEVE